jgi:Zn-dependent peptidase ImmA (M78 family)
LVQGQAKVTSPSELAIRLLDRLDIRGKPDLVVVAERIGLRIVEVEAEAFDGSLVRALDGPKGIVAINQSIREPSRKRFSIGHEIGHYLIPGHRNLENVCAGGVIESWQKGLSKPELEANEFAVELLLPGRYVRDSLQLNDPSLSTIARVATQFETSLTATTLRFVDLTNLACVAVWSEKRSVRWYRRSSTFPFYLSKDSLPSDESFAGRLFEGRAAPDDFAEVPARAWLDWRDADKVVRVLEHSIRLPTYDAVLTLLSCTLRDIVDEDDAPTLDDLDPEDFTLKRKRWPR